MNLFLACGCVTIMQSFTCLILIVIAKIYRFTFVVTELDFHVLVGIIDSVVALEG
jgi:hypothetical protein